MEGHHPSIWDHKHSWQDRHLRALYVRSSVLTQPAQGSQLPTSIVPVATYGELHPSSSQGTDLFKEPGCPAPL